MSDKNSAEYRTVLALFEDGRITAEERDKLLSALGYGDGADEKSASKESKREAREKRREKIRAEQAKLKAERDRFLAERKALALKRKKLRDGVDEKLIDEFDEEMDRFDEQMDELDEEMDELDEEMDELDEEFDEFDEEFGEAFDEFDEDFNRAFEKAGKELAHNLESVENKVSVAVESGVRAASAALKKVGETLRRVFSSDAQGSAQGEAHEADDDELFAPETPESPEAPVSPVSPVSPVTPESPVSPASPVSARARGKEEADKSEIDRDDDNSVPFEERTVTVKYIGENGAFIVNEKAKNVNKMKKSCIKTMGAWAYDALSEKLDEKFIGTCKLFHGDEMLMISVLKKN